MNRSLTTMTAAAMIVALSACGSIRGEVTLVGEDGAVYQIDSTDSNDSTDSTDTTDSTASIETIGAARPAAALAVIEIGADAAVPAAFRFDATLVDGSPIDGASLAAAGPLVVTFVQTTCPISDDERPNLAEAAERHPDVTFVAVHSGGTRETYLETIASDGLQRPNVINVDDSDLALWHRFGVTASPSNVLVDSSGLLRSAQGALGDSGLDRAATAVLDGF